MNLAKRTVTVGMAGLGAMILILATAVMSAAAQSGTTQITSAVLSVYQTNDSTGETVSVYPISKTWAENSLTWNTFANSYWPTAIGSFVTDGGGWRSVTITAQVQTWVDNPAQNFGVALVQGPTQVTSYLSSESADIAHRPKLDMCYIRNGGAETCVTIQRPGDAQGNVADVDLWEANPDDENGGAADPLFTGQFTNAPFGSGLKIATLRFDLSTPTAITLQSLSAHAVPAPGVGLLFIGTVGLIGLVIWRKRNSSN